ncbi:PAS domain S-box-containing protein [Geosporobacter subterraneus DSM 17957]|uniref:PAS domain S-box-containing protein n=1 Tax=Geosporobacter subterraneus DSM 17957 TaxID=1121919 RepID=A0A1M6J9R6_9FIRM|nr:sigma 54-interacting transcriptional regulator [Geosporobacter subterraneus]SHJ43445.1 PAS domain S-box-containing protein [Geosporobacter subterraneus DSM 17957]
MRNNANFIFEKSYIERSHHRCRQMGIEYSRIYSSRVLTDDFLQKKLAENRNLILSAEPFMNQLYNFVKGSNFFAILTDGEGCILSVIGDEEILSEAFELEMIPGASMAEAHIGTNAMGTAIAEGMPVQVSGKEHYIRAYHRWTCSAAPIRNPQGEIIGTLDLTGYSDLVHSHTLGMVVAAANAIEKMLEAKSYNDELTIAKKHIETIIDSIPAGILTSDLNGKIKAINKSVTEIFGYDEKEMHQMKIWHLFEGWTQVKDNLLGKSSFIDEDVYVNARKNKLQLNLSAYPIFDSEGILREITYVFKEVKRARKLATKIIGRQAIYTFDKIIGKNERFIQTIEYAKKIADSKSTILIMGESGTGKEIFAQSIHNYSNRKEEPFIAVNCGAIPRNLIESELFGYEEGAFTGARKGGNAGKFEMADGGTIFLDEIGEMPLDMQTNLLRVIEESTVIRVGGSKQIPVNVRIIAATNKDLRQEVEKGHFRKDLYYRLHVLPIYLSPLRERKDDIPLLIEYFMETLSRRLNKRPVEIPPAYMDHFIHHPWPGNIRELENLIELIINTEYIPLDIAAGQDHKKIPIAPVKESIFTLDQVEHQHILKVIKKYKGNISLTADALGIGRNTLYRKIEKYGIDCSDLDQLSTAEPPQLGNVVPF